MPLYASVSDCPLYAGSLNHWVSNNRNSLVSAHIWTRNLSKRGVSDESVVMFIIRMHKPAIKKSKYETGNTLWKIIESLKSLEVNQLLTRVRGNISFVAEGPLQQFQIDLIYMPMSWFNNGLKNIFCCIDVCSKSADMISLKDRKQTTTKKNWKYWIIWVCLKLYIRMRI